jgi:hypothetical protein
MCKTVREDIPPTINYWIFKPTVAKYIKQKNDCQKMSGHSMISHKHKLIFVHLPRTGGTAIESVICGKSWGKIDKKTKHVDWKVAKKIYKKEWDGYLKFGVVRNPWDLMVSLYHSHRGLRQRVHKKNGQCIKVSWDEWLKSPILAPGEQDIFRTTAPMSDCLGPDIDVILRFENLQNEFGDMCLKHIGSQLALPHYSNSIEQTNIGFHSRPHRSTINRRHYSTRYNDEQIEIVRKLFIDDLMTYAYMFEDKRDE